ncbi:hypothetical protein [Actinomycetospora sp. CA-084318]|uniref:hypothetical protein n=1 Tax=Actinomycetospora sp. CA-084318 TaxID=3239892 RepID=UPI003D96E063
MSRIQRHDDGLEVDVHPGREEFAARVVAEREGLVGKALHLMSLYLNLDRRGFHLDTITVPTAGEAELSFSWSSAEEPEAEGYTRFDVSFSADLHPTGFAVRFV